MVRMTDLLKKAKRQFGVFERKEALPSRKEPSPPPPTPPPLEEKRPPVREEHPPLPQEEVKKPGIYKKEPIKYPQPEKEHVPEKKEPLLEREEKRPPEERVEFADLISGYAKKRPLEKEEISRGFMRPSIPEEEETKKIYYQAAESMAKIFDIYKDGGEIKKEEITEIAGKIVNNIILGSTALSKLFHEVDSLELYIYLNAINVSVLSTEMGMVYGFNKSALLDLAIVGLLHDMDLIKSKHIIDMPKKLDQKELGEVMKHPLNVASYVDSAFNLSKDVVNAILQHHERKSGQGYPAGLTEADIQELAEIVGIADTYEAMTHSRPYKEKMSGHEAILNIINFGKELFSNQAIKALVSCVGLYPVGSWVELNTGEICRVLITNPEAPLRPVISIIMDKDRNEYRQVRTIDLQNTPSLYIKDVLKKAVK